MSDTQNPTGAASELDVDEPARDPWSDQAEAKNTDEMVLEYLREFEQHEVGQSTSGGQKWTLRRRSTVPLIGAAAPQELPARDKPTAEYPAEDKPTSEYRFVEPSAAASGDGGKIGVDEDALNIGKRYRIESGLGIGGMGSVFKVVHRRLGKTFALKIINPSLSEDSKMQRLFYQEAQSLSQLEHPHIVAVTDFGTDERFGTFLVMEYLHGETLQERINRQNRLGVASGLQIVLQVARAVHYMHQRELVHCDIKAANVFLCNQHEGEGRRVAAKLIDFGMTRQAAGDAQLATSDIGGTPMYASPEQLGGAAPQTSMDIYAIGVLMFEVLTGQPLFSGSLPEIYEQKCSETFPMLSDVLGSGVDMRLDSLFARTLRANPADRHPSMGNLVYELRTLTEMLGHDAGRRRRRNHGSEPPVPKAPPSAFAGDSELQALNSVDKCPLPVFVVNAEGCIAIASRGFCVMAQETTGSLLGQRPGATRLVNIYPEIDEDVAAVLSNLQPVQRTVQIVNGDQTEASLIIRLVPWCEEEGAPIYVWGNIIPLM